MKLHGAAADGLATGAFQKCNWGQIDPMVDRGLRLQGQNKLISLFGYSIAVLITPLLKIQLKGLQKTPLLKIQLKGLQK